MECSIHGRTKVRPTSKRNPIQSMRLHPMNWFNASGLTGWSFAKYAGTEFKVDGKKLLILKESDLLAVIEPEEVIKAKKK